MKNHLCLSVLICGSFTFVLTATAGKIPDSLRSFGAEERQQVLNALSLQGITAQELSFEKKWATDSFFRLKVVDDLLDHPLQGPDYVDSAAMLVQEWQDDIPALLVYEAQQTDIPVAFAETIALNRELDRLSSSQVKSIPNVSENVVQSVRLILASFELGGRYLKEATRNLTRDDIQKLLIAAPTLWGDEDDTTEHYLKGALQREYDVACDTSLKIDTDTLLPIYRKLDRKALALSGIVVGLAVNRARVLLTLTETTYVHEAQPVKAEGVSGDVLFYQETRWGKVAVGGRGPNGYDGDFALVIDLGGDDRYSGRIGGAVGLLEDSGPSPFSVCIDVNGNDHYEASNRLFNHGAAVFGAGMLLDLGGNDVYRSYHNAQGVGMYGTGVLADFGGNDFYEAGWFAQGGATVGLGLILDAQGDDVYRSFNYCQGFAGVWGYGLLADYRGNDIYYAGGKYIHHPLLPNDYRSFGQGFAVGWRPDCAGGIGFLYDHAGNDFYNAEVFAQACSYWYSLGMIYDGGGNDHYNANQYSQGAGIHLSVGILIDQSGDDQYFSRLGPTQGEGHDLSVGILIDRKGNDSYTCSGGQGIGLTNSVGIFIDGAGQDNYMTAENLGQGSGNWARGFGGIGVFVDEDGDKDSYVKVSPGEDYSSWTQGTYGSGISLKAKPAPATPAEETTYTPDSTRAKRPVKDVFKDAALWEVGEVRNKVKKARKELVALGREAAEYIAQEKLSSKDGLELRAMEDVAKAMPETIAPYLYQALHDPNRWKRANASYLLGQAKPKGARDSLLAALKLPGYRPRWSISAFGDLGDQTVVPAILFYLHDSYEPTRITTASTCGKLKNPAAVSELLNALDDPMFTVRSAAEQALVDIGDTLVILKIGTPPVFAAKTVASLFSEESRRWTARQLPHVVRLLGTLAAKLDTTERRAQRIHARNSLAQYLDQPEPAVRAMAVEALGKVMDQTARELLERKMADEADRFVLKKYREVLNRNGTTDGK
jgi:HEAT repeat protein